MEYGVSANNTSFGRPRRSQHPAAAKALEFKEQWAREHSDQPESTEDSQTPQTNGATISANEAAPVPPAVTSGSEVNYVPIDQMAVPDDLRNLFGLGESAETIEKPASDSSEAISRLEQDRNLLEELKKAKEEKEQLLKELQDIKSGSQLDDILGQMGPEEFVSLDPSDARKLLKPVLDRVSQITTKKEQDFAASFSKTQEELNRLKEEQRAHQNKLKMDSMLREIRRAIPDIDEFTKSKQYQEIMARPFGNGIDAPTGTVLAGAWQSGKVGSVIEILKSAKAVNNAPQLEDVVSVSPSVAASMPSVGTVDDASILSDDELGKLLKQAQTGRITRAEYRERFQKHKEAVAKSKIASGTGR